MPALLLTVLLAMSPPGDATRLAPGPAGAGPDPVPAGAPETPVPPEIPVLPLSAIGAAAAVLAGTRRQRQPGGDPAPGGALGLAPQPLVVFVPGHGNGPADFDDLAGLMDLDPGGYRVFDYRWAVETTDPVRASQAASIDATADALNAYLAGLGDGTRRLYLVGFSKGGAAIAELLARWDAGAPAPVEGVAGAALLDPPLASGFHGTVQSLGRYVGPIPDDGGYDPIRCDWTRIRCVDTRRRLGEAAGVEVVVLRNPKAGITSFDDRPEGLRVYDVPDAGRGPLASVLHNPFSYPMRMAEAHDAVLHDARVADCIRAEMRHAGSCRIAPLRGFGGETGGGGGGAAW